MCNDLQIMRIRSLIETLNYYTKLYDEGKPEIPDYDWDRMYFNLVALEEETGVIYPDSPTQKISYEVVNSLKKVKHNHPMLSLAKTKSIDELNAFINNKSCILMGKMDGLTCSLQYIQGKLVAAETRGDGIIGEDILHNAMVVKNIPLEIPYKEDLIVDGEIICKIDDFEKVGQGYANPRNFAAGSIRLLDPFESEKRQLSFIAWDIIDKNNIFISLLEKLLYLKDLGFSTVPHIGIHAISQEFIDDMKKLCNDLHYPIDGLVVKYNNCEEYEACGRTDHHFRGGMAFKFADEEYDTWLKDIEWTMGRTGQLTPVAIFDPVDTGDSIIERANLHNITIMKKLLGTPYQGQTIVVYKANDIIPQVLSGGIPETKADILGLEFDIPTVCPICGGETKVVCEVDTEVLMCTNDTCAGKLINRLDHFAGKKGLDIKGLSKATLEKLIEWGWVSELCDLYKLNKYSNEWKSKPGFGEKSVENILSAIEDSRTPKLENFISAIGIPFIGRTLSRELAKIFPSYDSFRAAVKEHYDFTTIEGIGYEKAVSLWEFDYFEADCVDDYFLGYEAITSTETQNTLSNESICITGKLKNYKNRDEFAAAIRDHGGKVVSSVSSNTTYLINNDINSTSAKNKKAKSLNIPIITEDEFINKFFAE